jgi:2-polyprenyl-3-methyl-5-hydroxy-6-metoxy-1,4-benzoquinol methylase
MQGRESRVTPPDSPRTGAKVAVLRRIDIGKTICRNLSGLSSPGLKGYLIMAGLERTQETQRHTKVLADHKDFEQGKKKISRSEIKKIIDSHSKWYQNIRFGFMLETHHTRRSLDRKILAECRLLVMNALGKKTKEQALITSLPNLRGKQVIDVGCNSGLYAVEASCRGADFVLAVDVNPEAIEQARAIAEIYRRLGRPVGKVEFRVGNINNCLDILDGMDILIACCVLYHLGPLHRFKKRISKSKIHCLIIQGNTARTSKIAQYKNSSSEEYKLENQTWGNILCDIKGMTDFCHSINFRVENVMFPRYQYPIVIAVRNEDKRILLHQPDQYT